jgi:predicted negative regulator of RcsB-dependent stress response
VAEINDRKRGAPWILISLVLVVAVVIGWWLWSNRSIGSETTSPPGTAADSTAVKTDTR